MNQTMQTARRSDGLAFMALLIVAFVVAVGFLIRDYRSPPVQALAMARPRFAGLRP